MNKMNEYIAQVTFGSDENLSIYKWVRTNLGLGIKESKELVNGKVIDFNGNTKQALEFYEYVDNCKITATLNIKMECIPYTGAVGADCVSLEDMDEDKLFNDELLSFDKASELAKSRSIENYDENHPTERLAYIHGFMNYYNTLESPKISKELANEGNIEPQFPGYYDIDGTDDSLNEFDSITPYEVYRYLKHWYYGIVADVLLNKKQAPKFWENLSDEFYNDKIAHDYKDGKFDYRTIREWFLKHDNKKLKEFDSEKSEENNCLNCQFGNSYGELICMSCNNKYSNWKPINQ